VIDLRDTPSGGNSAVARGIMGRLVDKLLPYQRHELVSEFRSTEIRRVWDEYVAPRGSPFLKPIVVLVGRWTGSMGEGLAIGLNATRGAMVLGRPMAHLLGANGEAVCRTRRSSCAFPRKNSFTSTAFLARPSFLVPSLRRIQTHWLRIGTLGPQLPWP
jgi:hypothetical protein